MAEHPTNVKGYQKPLIYLISELSLMSFAKKAYFVELMGLEFRRQADTDSASNRPQLANALYILSASLVGLSKVMEQYAAKQEFHVMERARIIGFQGTLAELVQGICNMKYNSVKFVWERFAQSTCRILPQANWEQEFGKPTYSLDLVNAICEPHMK